ncbi:MAG TPA: hypothetical protein VMH81_11485 [Bryobacteraceae bacterium]|nr:hypothetical protein [Bryobacteraceae bacterium]
MRGTAKPAITTGAVQLIAMMGYERQVRARDFPRLAGAPDSLRRSSTGTVLLASWRSVSTPAEKYRIHHAAAQRSRAGGGMEAANLSGIP